MRMGSVLCPVLEQEWRIHIDVYLNCVSARDGLMCSGGPLESLLPCDIIAFLVCVSMPYEGHTVEQYVFWGVSLETEPRAFSHARKVHSPCLYELFSSVEGGK